MAETALICAGCEREVELCALCESEACAEAVCYRCLTVDLGEAVRGPHLHGG